MSARIDQLLSVLASRGEDPFVWYALAIEYKNEGLEDRALEYFKEVHTRFPTYVPNFLHYGLLLDATGDSESAKAILEEGLEVSERAGDHHAHSELRAARDGIF